MCEDFCYGKIANGAVVLRMAGVNSGVPTIW